MENSFLQRLWKTSSLWPPQLVLHLVYKLGYFLRRPDNLHVCVCPFLRRNVFFPGVSSLMPVFSPSKILFWGLDCGGREWNWIIFLFLFLKELILEIKLVVKKLPYLLSEGLALLCVHLIPKSRKLFYTQQEDVFLEEFITYLWPLNLFMVIYIIYI